MKKANAKKDNKKGIFNKKILCLLIIVAVLSVIAIVLLLAKTFANVILSSPISDNRIEFTCDEYTSFGGKAKCNILVDLVPGAEISGLSIKLSKEPSSVEKYLGNHYDEDSMVLNEGKYVDIMFANNLHEDEYGVAEDLATVWFDNVAENETISVEEVVYYDSKAGVYDIGQDTGVEATILNDRNTPKKPSYSLNNLPGGPKFITIDDFTQYLFIPNYSGNLYSYINTLFEDDLNMEGCSYDISSDGKKVVVHDMFDNSKIINVIYIDLKDSNSYTLQWGSSENIYTRDAHTDSQVKKDCYDTNGYFSFDTNNYKIKLYADSEHTKLIDEKNWYYIYSSVYNFGNDGSISLTGNISYQDFVNTISSHGVTYEVVSCENSDCNNGNVITSGNLPLFSKLNILNVPGYEKDVVTIHSNNSVVIDINNINYEYIDGAANSTFYVLYDIGPATTVSDILNNFSISDNLTVKIVNKSLNELFSGTYEEAIVAAKSITAATDMKIVISNGTSYYNYSISVLGDLNSDGDITLSDIIKLYKISKNKVEDLTDAERFAGDVIDLDDKVIDTLDVAHLYRFFRGADNVLKMKPLKPKYNG